jgi:HlyD family secretion protein
MKKILKSKIFWIILILLILGGIAAKVFIFKGKITEYVIQDVVKGDVTQTVSATGKIKSASEIELNFKNSAKIAAINVKVGDKVAKDQVLAKQRSNDLSANVDKARANLLQAQANLAKLKFGATSQDVAVYEAAVQKAKTDLDNANSDLENTKSTYAQALESKRQSSLLDANSAIAKGFVSLQKIYDTLYYKGYSSNLVVGNPILLETVKDGYDLSKNLMNKAQTDFQAANAGSDLAKSKTAVDSILSALYKLSNTLDDLSSLLDTVIITTNLSRTELDTLKTTINSEWHTTNSALNTIQSDKQGLADAELSYRTKVEAAQNLVKTYEKNLIKSQADLNYKQAPARTEDIHLYEAQVLSAQADLNLAYDRLDETVIRAPIDGIITAVNSEVGEVSGLSLPVFKMLTNQTYEIEVDIPESDIAKISVGDKSDITLDAFTSDDIFSGAITKIDPAETRIQDVIYYKVTVSLESQQPASVQSLVEKIKPGMTANVSVLTAKIENVLVIPYRAVKDINGAKTVDILENQKPVTVNIEIGLKGNEGQVEVKSGLIEGQKVITFVRTK